ncbi:MAG TPA: hypothetical protein VN833_30515 [Candidatus Acidoferrales bacterium]|nr:hypothetical protein [Candidatus Acidoferrales bacterium]
MATTHLEVTRANALQSTKLQGPMPTPRASAAYKDVPRPLERRQSRYPILKKAKPEYAKLQ